MKNKLLILLLLTGVLLPTTDSVSADEGENVVTADIKTTYKLVDLNGNETISSFEELEEITRKENTERWKATLSRGLAAGRKEIKYGVVNFKIKGSSGINTEYTLDSSGRGGYTNGYYAADGAFLGYTKDGKVKFMQAGAIGYVPASQVEILDYEDESVVRSVNFYRCENGRIYHYGTNNIKGPYYWMVNDIGPQQSYMKANQVYYSYDGHYFYTTYQKMIDDYKSGTFKNSINPEAPYFNYFQFLSHRSKTNFNASDFDNFLKTKTSNAKSKMNGLGNAFVEYQNEYGTNAILTYGVAANESGWGNSIIAQSKNNLFGHGAVDSNPYYGANGYKTPGDSVLYHSKDFISIGYLDICDGVYMNGKPYSSNYCLKGRYFGSHLGDKESGINVKYASDPYWGEKAAALGWNIERYKGNDNTDINKYTVAIKLSDDRLNIRKEPKTTSTLLYQSPNSRYVPFIILDTVKGETVNGSDKWYKIQSDTTLNNNGSSLTQDEGDYDYQKDIGYIHSSFVTLINSEIGQNNPDRPAKKRGDVNGDGKITAADYLMIKDSIMGKFNLSNEQKKNADVNNDNKVTSVDYLMIKDYIMGKIKL